MNEVNPRMKRKSPLPFTKPWEPRVVYRANFVVVTIPFLVEDRKRLLFITRLMGLPVDTRETPQGRLKSKRTTSKELCFSFFVEIEIKSLKRGVGIIATQAKSRKGLPTFLS